MELDRLASLELPTLAEIVWGRAKDLRPPKKWHGRKQDHFELVAERYDAAFDHRVDYRLWRDSLYGGEGPHTEAFRPLAASWVEEVIDHPESTIAWGALATVAGLITSKRQTFWSDDEVLSLASACERRLFGGIEVPADSVHGCAVIKVLTLDAIQKTREHLRAGSSLVGVEDHVGTVTRWLREIDPQWQPGKVLWTKRLQEEARSGQSILPLSGPQATFRLVRVLFHTRAVIRVAATDGNACAPGLLALGAKYALSTWLTARHHRLGIVDYNQRHGLQKGHYSLDGLMDDEMTALFRAAQAARDTEDHLSSARLAHLLLRVIPTRTARRAAFAGIADKVSASIREAGLEVDERFTRGGLMDEQRQPVAENDTGGRDAGPSDSPHHHLPSPFTLQLTRDQQVDQRWVRLLEKYPTMRGNRRLRLLSDTLEGGQPVEQEHLYDAFDLALHYGLLKTAGKIFRHVAPRTGDVVKFASAVGRSFETNPFGIDGERQAIWRDTLRGAWADSSATEDLTPEQGILLHEVLLGRSTLLLRDAPDSLRRSLTRKYYERLSDIDLRALYRSMGAGPRSRRPRLHGRHLVRRVRRLEDVNGEPVVLASLVPVDGERWSILTVDRHRCHLHKPRSFGEVLSDADRVRATHELWRWHLQPIAWPSSVAAVGRAVVGHFPKSEQQAGWLVLAVDPRLATIPWQDLLTNWLGEDRAVSIIPTLGWLETIRDRPPFAGPDRTLIDRSPEFSSIRDGVTRGLRGPRRGRQAAAVVIGHGVSGGADIPSVVVNDRALGMEDWLEIGRRPTVMVYSCSAGTAEAGFLGDLGGLPGVLLGTGCDVLFAPVTDVNVSTAEVLNRHLLDVEMGPTLARRYLSAVAEDPAVALFNVYGLAGTTL